MPSFVIRGGRKLRGTVYISGSKNAALPILAATLLTDQPCTIHTVPNIADIHTMLQILRHLGSRVSFKNHTVEILNDSIKLEQLPEELVCKMRASAVLLGPLAARFGRVNSPYPGGCVLGARSIDTHLNVFKQFGIKTRLSGEEITLSGKPRAAEVVMPEFSVTATENALTAAVLAQGSTTIHLAALEPHVQDLAHFLVKMGAIISGIGSHTLTVRGVKKLKGAHYSVTPDYLEAGTFILAAILTKGSVTVKNIVPHDLDAFFNLLRETGAKFRIGKNSVSILKTPRLAACMRLQTNVFPGFPTDLQPPFVVLLTQARGKSKIHETLFEGRFNYFPELIKMGAKIERLNPHEAVISGPTPLRATTVKSWDIRAGAAMILAALIAKGKTTVTDIHYIDRGYERFDEKLRDLGADIERI